MHPPKPKKISGPVANSPAEGAAAPHPHMLLALLAGVSIALCAILLPFYGTILWGTIIAVLFAGVNRRLRNKLAGRRTLAALLTLALALVIVVFPLIIVTGLLSRELALLYQQMQSGETQPIAFLQRVFDSLPSWLASLLQSVGLNNFASLQRKLAAGVEQASQAIASHVFSLGQDTFNFAVSVFVALYVSFFMIRDGDRLLSLLRSSVPLAPQHKQQLLDRFTGVVRAAVKGNLLVACIQGALGGVAFWFLGISSAVLWAALMALTSLLPAVGAALVWFPVAVYFLITGAIWQGVALMVFGLLVIGLVDNLLRPILVGRDAGLPDYLVLLSTIGGIASFGINGLVLGPMIAALFIAVWHIYLEPKPVL